MKIPYILFAIAAGLLVLGVFREDTLDIFVNAVVVCFSCIGIG
jgi:hypothetical protein